MAPPAMESRKAKRKAAREEKKRSRNKRQRGPEPAQQDKQKQQQRERRPAGFKRPHGRRAGGGGAVESGGFVNRFHELVEETTGASMTAHAAGARKPHKEALSTEDREIKMLESKLGLSSSNSGLKKLQKEYERDGLGADFTDFLSDLDKISKIVKEHKPSASSAEDAEAEYDGEEEDSGEEDEDSGGEGDENDAFMGEDGFEMDEETRKEMAMLQAEDAEFLRGMDELPTDESDLDSDVDLAEFESTDDEAEDDEEIAANTRRNQQAATSEEEEEEVEEEEEDASAKSDQEAEDSENDDEDIDEAAPVVEEDIYGRPVVKASTAAAPSAYLPPHLRRKLQAEAEKAAAEASSGDKKALLTPKMDEQALRELTRRINGQLNRISESNMEPIALEMEALYRQNVRSAVNQILHDKMLQTACHPRQVMTSLIKVCSALVAALYHSVGTELGGFFVEKIVRQLNDAIEAGKSQEASVAAAAGNDDEASETSKEPVNLVLFVAMLYNFGVVHCTLVYDLFRSLVASFSSIEIELIHHLLKASGAQLRADDADALREMIALVQQKVVEVQASGPDSQQGDRIRFILDLIYDLKKPASKQKKAAGSAALDLTSLKKWLGRVKTRCGNANNPLRVSLHELLHADEDGRWWVVGGTWVGYQASKAADTNADELDDEKDGKAQQRSEEARLLRLAEKQRMNTDVRKRIFVAIMGAADCLDAYERLLQLNLREKQEREIVRVLLHCCGQEKKFNQYYLVLADKLCEMDPRYKFTFQLAYWDVFKQIETLAPRRLYNQALMLAGLVTSASLSLSCLKVLDFTQLEDKAVLFLRVVLEKVLKLESELEMARVFQRLLQTKKAQLTIDGLAVFMHQHMTSFRGEQDPAARTLLKKRAKSARNLLDQLAKSAALTEHRESFK